jgi:DNA-binding NarL/FixJ family response regulator
MLHWAEVGAVGFVPRDASLEDLVETIERGAGELRCTATLAAKLVQALSRGSVRRGTRAAQPAHARESEIVQLIDEGLSNKEIAVRLGIEVATVKNHVHNLLENCGCIGASRPPPGCEARILAGRPAGVVLSTDY